MTTDNKLNAATKWWNKLSPLERGVLRDMNNISSSATDSEILSIWEKETKPDGSPTVSDESRNDFDRGFTAGYNASAKSNASYEKEIAELKTENEQLKARLTEC